MGGNGEFPMDSFGSHEHSADPAAILVVEDDSLVRETIVEHLKDCGYFVVEAASAEEAQTMLRSGINIDLVFSDVVMPGQNGFELASWIRSQFAKMRILLTSGYDSAARRVADKPNADRFPTKPYLPGQVVQLIEMMLHGA